ncbi:MAG: dipeptidase PepE [Bacteroidales bacterium]|nr:dipeptidase PepE [Bacteroidales bacterium]MCB9000118.1 dipeptidase PepE [Bacteroidales bacterium]MCB9014128.1 dipeptidase PepE [Bacteroidales bacterium]
MRLLLISNSTNAGEEYLSYPMPQISEFLGSKKINILFIPYAGVTISYDEYVKKVNNRFLGIGHTVKSIHNFSDPLQAVQEAEVIVTGGGNTWQLLSCLQERNLLEAIRARVLSGVPYIGWSAGSNLACPTIRTTNDMPVVQPKGFSALNLVPFQINPHYLDANPDGHAGETREDRILEFLELNRDITVVGLREGTMFWMENKTIRLIGKRKARIFRYGKSPQELSSDDDFKFLLKQ